MNEFHLRQPVIPSKLERFGGRPKCIFPRASSNLKKWRRNYVLCLR